MTRDNPVSRRTALKLTGGAAATALVAGCGGNGGNGEENGDENDSNGGENGGGGGSDGIEVEPGTIEFSAQTAGWEGVAPSAIEGETNPTLILQEGEEYEIGWNEGDGSEHNIEIRDDGGEVVDDLSTEPSTEGGDDQFLTFDAGSDMVQYVCNPHETTMVGDLVVE